MCLKAIKRLVLYVWTNYKNGLDVQMCLDTEELILLEETIVLDNPIPRTREMWDLGATANIKKEELLKQNLISLYTVIMSCVRQGVQPQGFCKHQAY